MRTPLRTGGPALALAAVLVTSSCGSDNGDDAPTDQRPTEETTSDEDSDDGSNGAESEGDESDDEAAETLEGLWQSDDRESRRVVLADDTFVLIEGDTDCTGSYGGGSPPVPVTVICHDSVRDGHVTPDGDTLTIDWEDEGPERYTWVAPPEN